MLRDLFSLFPAYAGVILEISAIFTPPFSFPRIRGGDPTRLGTHCPLPGLFPAYAGVIPIVLSFLLEPNPFPRIRGGDPCKKGGSPEKSGFSPHTRG